MTTTKNNSSAGMLLRWEGEGVNEVAYSVTPTTVNVGKNEVTAGSDRQSMTPAAWIADQVRNDNTEMPIIRIDPRYFRPTEVETLLGNPGKAKQKLGWVPEITAQEMCAEMVAHDLAQARQHALLRANGYSVNVSVE